MLLLPALAVPRVRKEPLEVQRAKQAEAKEANAARVAAQLAKNEGKVGAAGI